MHAEVSGVATGVYDDEVSCLEDVRFFVSLLPANRRCESLLDIVPKVGTLLTGGVASDFTIRRL